MNSENVVKFYDPIAEMYEDLAQRWSYVGPAWLQRALPVYVPSKPERIVDLACANGLLGKILRRTFAQSEITGIDISPRMIEQARYANVYDHLNVFDLNEPVETILSDAFDLVVGLGFVEFLEYPANLLHSLNNLLSRQGVMLLSFQEYLPDEPEKASRITRSGEMIHHAYTRHELEAMFSDAGLQLVSLESMVGYEGGGGFLCPYLMAIAGHS